MVVGAGERVVDGRAVVGTAVTAGATGAAVVATALVDGAGPVSVPAPWAERFEPAQPATPRAARATSANRPRAERELGPDDEREAVVTTWAG